MAGRLDPPHDRVTLSMDELHTLAALEQLLAEPPVPGSGHGTPVRPRRTSWLRPMVLGACLRLAHLGPWLAPLGIVIMVVALPSSAVVSAVGAAVTGVGLAAFLQRPWLRAPMAHLRGRLGRR